MMGINRYIGSEEHLSRMRENNPMSNPDTAKRNANAKRGRALTEEHKTKMYFFPKGHVPWNKGKILSDATKKKLSEVQKGKHNSPSTEFVKGQKHAPISEETREKLRQAAIKQHSEGRGWKQPVGVYKCSEDRKEKLRVINTGRRHSVGTRKKISEDHIRNPNKKFKKTGIEIKIGKELLKRGIRFRQQKAVHGIAIVDFYLYDYNVVIECDGCYWHGCAIHYPNYYQDRAITDVERTKRMIAEGYKVYRFWEHEINESAEGCVNRIIEIL